MGGGAGGVVLGAGWGWDEWLVEEGAREHQYEKIERIEIIKIISCSWICSVLLCHFPFH